MGRFLAFLRAATTSFINPDRLQPADISAVKLLLDSMNRPGKVLSTHGSNISISAVMPRPSVVDQQALTAGLSPFGIRRREMPCYTALRITPAMTRSCARQHIPRQLYSSKRISGGSSLPVQRSSVAVRATTTSEDDDSRDSDAATFQATSSETSQRDSPIECRVTSQRDLAIFYAAWTAVHGLRLPYWPLWMSEVQGLTGPEIGLLMGTTQIARTLAAPAISLMSDSLNAPKQVATGLAFAGLATNVALLGSHDLVPLLVICSVSNCLFSAIMPIGESLAMTRLPADAYGQTRLWGSIGFIVANVMGGLVFAQHGTEWVMPLSIAANLAMAASCTRLPGPALPPAPEAKEASEPRQGWTAKPISMATPAVAASVPGDPPGYGVYTSGSTSSEAASLARNPTYITFLLAACLVQASHAAYYSFGTIILQQAGYSGTSIGALWGLGVAAEVALFAWKGLDRALNAWQLLAVGAAASVLRWMVMATCPSPPLLIAAQLLHGLTFGACHLGCIRFVQTAVPPRISATATAFIGAMSEGVFMAGATFVSGQVLASHGFGTFWLMSAMGAAGLAMSTLLGRIWDGRRLKLK